MTTTITPHNMGATPTPSDVLDLIDGLHLAWHRHAACRGMTDVFFPTLGESSRQAIEICATCPVRDECAAASTGERFGVWAGRHHEERARSATALNCVIALLATSPRWWTSTDIARHLDVNQATALRYFHLLAARGDVEQRVGPGPGSPVHVRMKGTR